MLQTGIFMLPPKETYMHCGSCSLFSSALRLCGLPLLVADLVEASNPSAFVWLFLEHLRYKTVKLVWDNNNKGSTVPSIALPEQPKERPFQVHKVQCVPEPRDFHARRHALSVLVSCQSPWIWRSCLLLPRQVRMRSRSPSWPKRQGKLCSGKEWKATRAVHSMHEAMQDSNWARHLDGDEKQTEISDMISRYLNSLKIQLCLGVHARARAHTQTLVFVYVSSGEGTDDSSQGHREMNLRRWSQDVEFHTVLALSTANLEFQFASGALVDFWSL